MQNHIVFPNRIVCATGSGEPEVKEKREEKRQRPRAGQKGRAKIGQMVAKRKKKRGKAKQRRAKGSHRGVREGQRGPQRVLANGY